MSSISNTAQTAMRQELCQIRPFRQDPCGERAWIMGSLYPNLSTCSAQRARLRAHLRSIVWFTYRCGFAPIHDVKDGECNDRAFTSDAGWGCMIRTGQMMLAETLRRHWNAGTPRNGDDDESTLLRLLHLFADTPTAPFSLRAIVHRGAARYDTQVGAWYGPTAISKVLRDLVEKHVDDDLLPPGGVCTNMAALVATDGVVYMSEVEARCCSHRGGASRFVGFNTTFDPLHHPPSQSEPAAWDCSLLLLIPLRLGLEKVSADYIQPLSAMFQFPQSVGLMGGKRAHALYFVGTHERDAFVLDPHTVQPAAMLATPESISAALHSLRTDPPRIMTLGDVDPSLALGFYCHERRDFEDLRQKIELMVDAPFMVASAPPDMSDGMLACVTNGMDDCEEADEEDEYVLISSGRE
jgi:cysteine protease ATG4